MGLQRLNAKTLTVEESKDIIQRSLELIILRSDPDKVILFGSAARNEMTVASDLEDSSALERGRKAFYSAPRRLNWPLDLIFVSQEAFDNQAATGGLFQICRDEGRKLYQKGN